MSGPLLVEINKGPGFSTIETYPPQSEIGIMMDSAGHQTHRILDVLTPSDSVMTLSSIHF